MLNKLLLDSWRFFANHFRVLAIIVLAIVLPIEIFASGYEYFFLDPEPTTQQLLMLRIPSIIAAPIYSVAVVFYLASIVYNKPLGIAALWQLGLKFWLVYFILSLLIGIMAGFGLVLFILPGIFLLAKFAFAQFDLLLNGTNPIVALKNSWQQTTGYTLTLLGGYIVIAVMLFAVYLVFASLLQLFNFDATALQGQKSAFLIIYELVLTVTYNLLELLLTIFAFRVYDLARNQSQPRMN